MVVRRLLFRKGVVKKTTPSGGLFWGYIFGFEILIINGLLVFAGLFFIRKRGTLINFQGSVLNRHNLPHKPRGFFGINSIQRITAV
jgi:hypothetical protein